MYSIELSQTSINFLNKLNKKDSDIILNKIFSLRDNPYRSLKRLQGQKLWRLRIGDYRAVIDVIIKGQRIFVVRIGHRKDIYKHLSLV
jgi:mRNA interferase RelE/StbE